MICSGDKITFEKCDMHFVERFGISAAADMVADYRSEHDLPFIFDSYQLSNFLILKRNDLFHLAKNASFEYRAFEIKKKNGKMRKLYAPSPRLRSVQRTINRGILSHIPISPFATAYKRGTGIKANAALHTNKRYILKLDITDFFGSITFEDVYSSTFNRRLFPAQIGVILTKLCCLNDRLPQGAPTSPTISNIVMKNFDLNLGSWCQKHSVAYSRYCDDLTFSSDLPLYNVYVKAKNMLKENGFELNESKTRFIKNSNCQSVTGLTVNEKVNVSKEYKRALRQDVYYALKFGENCEIKYGKAGFYEYLSSLSGKVNYVLSIEPENSFFLSARDELTKMNTRR